MPDYILIEMPLRRITNLLRLRRSASDPPPRKRLGTEIRKPHENCRGLIFKGKHDTWGEKQLQEQDSIFEGIRNLIGTPKGSEHRMRISLGISGRLYVEVNVRAKKGFKNRWFKIENEEILNRITELYDLNPI